MLCVCIAASDFESSLDLSATSDFACYLQPQNITFPSNEKPSVGIQPRGIKGVVFRLGAPSGQSCAFWLQEPQPHQSPTAY